MFDTSPSKKARQIGYTCSVNRRYKKHVTTVIGNLLGSDHLKDKNTGEMIILKWMLK
jgi:hypothetical protein